MDTQTRHALKEDKLVQATQVGIDWLQEHRSAAVRWTIACAVVVAAIVAGVVTYATRSSAAELALGSALDTYSAQLSQPGQPPTPGETTFSTAAERAKAANQQFVAIADRYGMLKAGKNARYFAGITALQMGQTGAAEKDLEQVANSHDENLASLAKLALASVYVQTGRSSEAVVLYKDLIAKPTATVPANAAQLQLAALYESTNPAQAMQIYAQLKNDKSPAGQIAAQKLAQK